MPKLPQPTDMNTVLPSATYLVRIASFERVEAKTGTPQIRWKAEVIEPEEYAKRVLVVHTPLTEKSLWKVANLIGACGLQYKPNIDTDSAHFSGLCQAAIGRTTMWVNQEDTDNKGNLRNNIVRFEADAEQETLAYELEEEGVPAWIEKGDPKDDG